MNNSTYGVVLGWFGLDCLTLPKEPDSVTYKKSQSESSFGLKPLLTLGTLDP